MADLCERLRDWAEHYDRAHATTNKRTGMSIVMHEAADEIARLRALADKRGEIAVNRRREIERLRLTDAEREAIEGAIASEHGRGAWAWADTLRGLLDRLGHRHSLPAGQAAVR